jgi:VanZ family protein
VTDFKATEEGSNGKVYGRIVTASCICVLCIILIAGLWPLHVPRNNVSWLKNKNGLLFGHEGSIVSAGALRPSGLEDDTSCSLEIWLAPSRIAQSKTILSFDGSAHPGNAFSIQQNKDGLRIQRHNVDDQGTSRTAWFTVGAVFRENKPVFVTIALGKQDTLVYLDGVLAKVSPLLGVSRNNFTGRIVVADSPAASNSWSGQILGLAIYHRQLTAAQVTQHWESWTKNLRPTLAEDEAPVALYLLNEGKGSIAHNELNSATDLIIPSRYFVLHPGFLLAPWREYKPTWSYWRDFSVNIAGFIPWGFCLAAYFSSVQVINRPRVTTIALGFVVSFTIEVLQTFLPTRSSGTTDLVTNTLGTAIGVTFYGCSFAQSLLAKVGRNLGGLVQDSSREDESGSPEVVSAV